MQTVVLGIVGVVEFTDYEAFKTKIDTYIARTFCTVNTIYSTVGKGTNELVKKYATEKGITFKLLEPDVKAYGEIAPLVVNNELVTHCSHIVVFWDKRNRVIKDLREKVISKNKNLMTYHYVETPLVPVVKTTTTATQEQSNV